MLSAIAVVNLFIAFLFFSCVSGKKKKKDLPSTLYVFLARLKVISVITLSSGHIYATVFSQLCCVAVWAQSMDCIWISTVCWFSPVAELDRKQLGKREGLELLHWWDAESGIQMCRYQVSIDRVLLIVLVYSTFSFVLGLKTLWVFSLFLKGVNQENDDRPQT